VRIRSSILHYFLGSLIFLQVIHGPVKAQHADYHLRVINESNGIQTTGITRILKDKKGFLWLMSAQLVQRYDGMQTRKFMVAQDQRDLIIDSQGTIWLVCYQGVYRFADDYRGFIKIGHNAPGSTRFYSAAEGDGDTLFFSASNGIYYCRTGSPIISKYPITGMEGQKPGRGQIIIRDHYLFVGITGGKLYRYNFITKELCNANDGDMIAFFPLTSNDVLVGGYDFTYRIIHFPSGSVQLLGPEHFSSSLSAISIPGPGFYQLNKNEFLLSTSKGVLKYNLATNFFTQQNLFLQGAILPPDIRCFFTYVDDDNTFWFSVPTAILYFNPSESSFGALHNYLVENSKSWDNWTRQITEDRQGNIWFGTYNGFCKWDKITGVVKPFYPEPGANDRLNFPSVRGVAFDGHNLILGQTNKGMWLFDPITEHYRRPQYAQGSAGDSAKAAIESEFIYGILPQKNGNFFVYASHGTYLLHKNSYLLEKIRIGSAVMITDNVLEDNKGFLWMYNINVDAKGLYCVDSNWQVKKIIPFSLRSDITNMRPYCLLNDSTLLCGSAGVWMVEHIHSNPVIRKIIPALDDKLPVRTIFKDNLGKIWIITLDEIYRYDPSSTLLEKFDYSDNITSSGLEANYIFRASDGTVYLNSLNGLNYFIPEKIAPQLEELGVQLLNVSFGKDDSSFFLKKNFSMKYNSNSVVFTFVAPYYKNAKKIFYRYRLEGEDRDWVTGGNNNSVRYSSLPAGDYTFRAAASTNGSTWYEMKEPFSFSIRPPFWQTWWLRLLAVGLIAAVIFYIVKRRITNIKTKAAIHLQLIQLEAKALRSQMNPHFIFNCLTSIDNLIQNNEKEKATTYLAKFAKLMRAILENSRTNVIPCWKDLETLKLYLELEELRWDKKFSCQLNIAPEIFQGDYKVPPMIIQPYVENAIHHGLLNKDSGSRNLIIAINVDKNHITYTVEDNGIGRKKAQEYKQLNRVSHESMGLDISRDRINLFNRQNNGSVIITDLCDENKKAAGTRVEVRLLNQP